MFAIGIRYLCGWAMATHPADRERAEWPPHPDRVFMALAAAHFESEGGASEYEALRALSALPPPALAVSEAEPRAVVTSFVPVNDDASPLDKKNRPMMAAGSLPIGRNRQPRSFPVAIPEDDTVYLIWPEADLPEPAREALAALCRRVGAVGHSASLVQMWVEHEPPAANMGPTDHPAASHRLRVTDPERLGTLQSRYEAELRPDVGDWKGYHRTAGASEQRTEARTSYFARDLIIHRRVDGQPLGLESTLMLTAALRAAVLKACPDPPPEWVSGHDGPNGPPSRKPHLAFLPLAHVEHAHADGRLLGAALALPREVPEEEARRCLAPFLYDEKRGYSRQQRLTFGSLGTWDIELDDRETRPWALRPEAWTARSKVWASVTPVVFDRYPKAKGDAERLVRLACQRVKLPEPESEDVVTTPAPWFVGSPHARQFPALPTGSRGGNRFHAHVLVRFPVPVEGPVLLGAGRYRGYGLLRPWKEDER